MRARNFDRRIQCIKIERIEFKRAKVSSTTMLFAINVISGNYQYTKVPKIFRAKVKAQIALMVEDDELLEELTKEDVAE